MKYNVFYHSDILRNANVENSDQNVLSVYLNISSSVCSCNEGYKVGCSSPPLFPVHLYTQTVGDGTIFTS